MLLFLDEVTQELHHGYPEHLVGFFSMHQASALPLLFGEKNLKTVCFNEFILTRALKLTRSVC